MMRSRKGTGLHWYFTLLAIFLGAMAYLLGTHQFIFREYPGQAALHLQDARLRADDAHLYTFLASQSALEHSLYDIGKMGGEEKCGNYLGYTLWTTENGEQSFCVPSAAELQSALSSLNEGYLDQFLLSYELLTQDIIPFSNFNILLTLGKETTATLTAQNPVIIPIGKGIDIRPKLEMSLLQTIGVTKPEPSPMLTPIVPLPTPSQPPTNAAAATTSSSSDGGGSATTAIDTVTATSSSSRAGGAIASGATTTLSITKEAIAVDSVTFTATTDLNSAGLTVGALSKNPVTDAPADATYQYLEVKSSNIGTTPLKDIKITFKVLVSWALEENVNKEDVTLYRHTDGAWAALPTSYVKSDGTYHYYTATTPGFSNFAIGGKKATTPITEEQPIQEQPSTPPPIVPAPQPPRPESPAAAPIAPSAQPSKSSIAAKVDELLKKRKSPLAGTAGKYFAQAEQRTGVPSAVLLAIAAQESGLKHCCAESKKNSGKTCKGTATLSCSESSVLTSTYSSIGVMQINAKVNSALAGRVCIPGQTIYDMECNINVGAKLLRDSYLRYENGIPPRLIKKYCKDPALREKYLSYRGWDAVLRAYNGLGCSKGADTSYVETVNTKIAQIQPAFE